MTPAVRRGLASGRATALSLDYLGIARHLVEGPPVDVVVAQLTPPDADGWCSPGPSSDFIPLAWPRARRRMAHLNPRLPRTRGRFRVRVDTIDVAVEADLPPLDYAEARAGDIETRIGAHVAGFVHDGDVLQFGIGSVPMALAAALAQHRRLRLHGGLVSSALRVLWDSGALDRDARITTGVVLGDAALRDFAASLDRLWLDDVTVTHGTAAIAAAAAGSRFVAVNGAVEVDLFGQVNSERAGGILQAGAGGLPAFAQAAHVTPDGRLLICLPASAKQGKVSRIVPALGDAGFCTLPRHLADGVVTEHGVVELRGLGLDARAEALIGIAAPEHRPALAEAWSRIRTAL
jgi:acyl-CoA hydrolase